MLFAGVKEKTLFDPIGLVRMEELSSKTKPISDKQSIIILKIHRYAVRNEFTSRVTLHTQVGSILRLVFIVHVTSRA